MTRVKTGITFVEASRRAEGYFLSLAAARNGDRIDCRYGWVFFGTKHDTNLFEKPGRVPTVCVAINKHTGTLYAVCPPVDTWIQCPHDDEITQFKNCGQIENNEVDPASRQRVRY